ncbi:MAG: hypothetical protein HFJ53_06140 [Clostridia bacterium]|jgi:hypothetical protein|nr:hypothetical protein [Clostridia bacterium]
MRKCEQYELSYLIYYKNGSVHQWGKEYAKRLIEKGGELKGYVYEFKEHEGEYIETDLEGNIILEGEESVLPADISRTSGKFTQEELEKFKIVIYNDIIKRNHNSY